MNKSWRQHPTKQQLYGHRPPITKTIKIRRTRHAEHCWRSRDELISDVLLWTLSHYWAKQDDRLELTYSSSVPIRDIALKICRKQWMIKMGGERGSGISVLVAWHHDDDDDKQPCPGFELSSQYPFPSKKTVTSCTYSYIYIYIYI